MCCAKVPQLRHNQTRQMSYWKWVIIAAAVTIVRSLTAEVEAAANASRPLVSKPGCPEKCGNVSIPYPFGIGDDCSYDYTFNISCNQPSLSPTPIYGTNLEVLSISLVEGQIRIPSFVARLCYSGSGEPLPYYYESHSINMPFFTFSRNNTLVATGCDTIALFTVRRSLNRSYSLGCSTKCASLQEVDKNIESCPSDSGCCQNEIPEGVHFIWFKAKSDKNYTHTSRELTPCSSAFVVAKDSFHFTLANLTMSPDQMPSMLPVVYDWTVGNETCASARAQGKCLCCNAQGSECDSKLGGYRCRCSTGYFGNPYLENGCHDIDECSAKEHNNCEGPASCVNTEGSYYCRCPEGFKGNGTNVYPCLPMPNNQTTLKIAVGVGSSIIFLPVLGFLLHWHYGNRQLTKMRSTFFRQNGGLILHQRLSKRDAPVDVIKIFTAEELKKATNNYSQNNIIGRGGFGVVYKGKLPNNQAVAIKKSLKVDSSQIEQFINEVLVLSQVNNRNVVKLLGCCLETEVPVLVYEFIRNGTLHDHLHGDQRKASLLPWDIRLRIATEVAQVLAYLHTTISTPIIHRDIKSMNILLDENYVAKVSDFGTSRLVPMDKQQVATMVQGTHGYLDPEYMQTGELNEKSDVYSFGVVLLELLTGRKALSFVVPQNERVLANHFLLKFNDKEQSILDIVDKKIKDSEATEQLIEQLTRTAILARRCVQLKGEDRPDMKEVAMELEDLMRGKY